MEGCRLLEVIIIIIIPSLLPIYHIYCTASPICITIIGVLIMHGGGEGNNIIEGEGGGKEGDLFLQFWSNLQFRINHCSFITTIMLK